MRMLQVVPLAMGDGLQMTGNQDAALTSIPDKNIFIT